MFNLYWHQALLWEWLPWQGWRPCFLLSRWAAWHKKQKNSQSVSECCCNSKLKTSYLVVLPIKLQGYTPWGSAFLSVRTLQRPRKPQPSTYKFRAGRSLGNRDLRSCWVGKVVVTSVHCKIELILLFCTFSCNLSSDCSCGSVNPAEMCSQVFWKVGQCCAIKSENSLKFDGLW